MQLLWEAVWQFLKKLNIESPCDPAIPLLGVYPRELKAYIHTQICTLMFIQALFIMAKKWKHSKCP